MNWKTRILIPVLKSLGLTLIVFAALLALCAAVAAHSIWIEGHHDTKFGNEWGNLQFYITIFSMILGVQCGILLVGNGISAVILGKVFTHVPIVVCVGFAAANASMVILKTDPTNTFFLFVLPGACAAITIIGTAIVKWRHPTSQMEDIVA